MDGRASRLSSSSSLTMISIIYTLLCATTASSSSAKNIPSVPETVQNNSSDSLQTLVYQMQNQLDFLLEKQEQDGVLIRSLEDQIRRGDSNTNQPPSSSSSIPDIAIRETLHALEGERRTLENLESSLTSLKNGLDELTGTRQQDVNMNDVREEIHTFNSEIRKLKSELAALRGLRDQDSHALNQANNDHVTVQWLKKTLESTRTNLADLQSSVNVSEALHYRQEVDGALTLLQKDVTALRRDLQSMTGEGEQEEVTLVQLQREVAEVRRLQHKMAATFTDVTQELNTIKEELLFWSPPVASSTDTPQQTTTAASLETTFDLDAYFRSALQHRPSHKLRHKNHGHLRSEVTTLQSALRLLHDRNIRLDAAVQDMRANLTDTADHVSRLQNQVGTLVDNRTGKLQSQSSLMRSVEYLSDRVATVERSVSNVTSGIAAVRDLHTTTLQLFDALEGLEGEYDNDITYVKKAISKFEFNMAQISSTVQVLKEDQGEHQDLISGLRKDITSMKIRQDTDHLRLVSLQNEAFNRSLQSCRSKNEELHQNLKIQGLQLKVSQLEDVSRNHREDISKVNDHLDSKLESGHVVQWARKVEDELHNVTSLLPSLSVTVTSVEENVRQLSHALPRDCSLLNHHTPDVTYQNGIYLIYPSNSSRPVSAFCQDGWLVVQRRQDGSEEFFRGWKSYQQGFGNVEGEFWIGNDILHLLTTQNDYVLRFDLWDVDGNFYYAEYDYFHVENASNNYRLHISGYHGNGTDAMSYHNNMEFSTKDADNDASTTNCALYYSAGWWYDHCQYVNVNGRYHLGLTWFNISENEWMQLSKVVMRIKPVSGVQHLNPA